MRAGEGAGDGAPGGGGLGGSPCSSRKASRSTYSTSPNGRVRSHSSGASSPGPGAVPGRARGDPPPTEAPAGTSAGPAVSRPGPGTGAVLSSFSFRRPAGWDGMGWDGLWGCSDGNGVADWDGVGRDRAEGEIRDETPGGKER